MNRSSILFISVVLLCLTMFFVLYNSYNAQQIKTHMAVLRSQFSNTGTDLLVECRPVQASVSTAPERPLLNEPFLFSMSLSNRATNNTCDTEMSNGVANEHSGDFSPQLTVGDCDVSPTQNNERSTQPLDAFRWTWTVANCKSDGEKVVNAALNFNGPPDSDPLAYRNFQVLHVVKPFSWDQLGSIVATLSGIATLVTSIAGVYKPKNPTEPSVHVAPAQMSPGAEPPERKQDQG